MESLSIVLTENGYIAVGMTDPAFEEKQSTDVEEV